MMYPPHWRRWGVANSIEAANKIWEKEIKGRGITAWTEFVSPEDAEKMIDDPAYLPRREKSI